MYDIIIIGAGPAGLTAGIYALRANLKVLIIEKESIGGQISTSPLVENYPGYKSISGLELSNSMYEQYNALGGELEVDEVTKIKKDDDFTVTTEYDEYRAKSIIIATGAKHRHLNIDREEDFIGKGLSYCATCDGAFFKDKIVAVIGGASTAVTSAIYLSNIAKKVYLIYRKSKLKCEDILKTRLDKLENVEIIYNSEVTKLIGKDVIEGIVLNDSDTIEVDGVFVSIGMEPNTKFVEKLIPITDDNYIDSLDTKTNIEGIFVAGDVRKKDLRQLTTAVSDGSLAATYAIDYIRSTK